MDRANIPQNNILNAIIKTATICNRCIVPTKKFKKVTYTNTDFIFELLILVRVQKMTGHTIRYTLRLQHSSIEGRMPKDYLLLVRRS